MGEKNYHDTWKNKIKILPRPKDSCWVDDGVNYNNDEEKIEGRRTADILSTYHVPRNMQNDAYISIHLGYYWSNKATL